MDEPIEVSWYFLNICIHRPYGLVFLNTCIYRPFGLILLNTNNLNVKAAHSSDRDGLVLKVNKLPEAMKLQHAENIFDGECIFYKTQIILETDSFILLF